VNFLARVGLLGALLTVASSLEAENLFGVLVFGSGPPPSYRSVSPEEASQIARGYELFLSPWHASLGQGEHMGLGPLYNATSCNECHVGGRHGIGPSGPVDAPTSLVVRLRASVAANVPGDPIYGQILSTHAVDGVMPEGAVQIEYGEISGYYYPYGGSWRMRVPHYHIVGLTRGPLAAATIISPRIAPALFGLGLLEAVPEASLRSEGMAGDPHRAADPALNPHRGRFGWQNEAESIRDQTTRAFADEMGVTSNNRPTDDCTRSESECRAFASAAPEVSDPMVEDLIAFLRLLAVPAAEEHRATHAVGAQLFESIGCVQCHQSHLTASLMGKDQAIAPYTDLRLHDLGMEMADETVGGVRVATRWRTAPLWGIGYRFQTEKEPTFLHDGRARSLEEAILWHYGEASLARFRFMSLGPNARNAVLRWLESR
jgi:CxxC motif-containing protein (DUF1111 family)